MNYYSTSALPSAAWEELVVCSGAFDSGLGIWVACLTAEFCELAAARTTSTAQRTRNGGLMSLGDGIWGVLKVRFFLVVVARPIV